MNRHELVDELVIRASGLLVRDGKLFARSLESPPIGDAVAGSRGPGLGLVGTDESTATAVDVETPAGTFQAAYLPWRWLGPEHPTLLYHHGSGERPFDFGRFSPNSFRRLFAAGEFDAPVNLVAVRAPFHDRSSREYARALGDLSNLVGMAAASTALVEALRARLVEVGCPAVTLAGLSLGGFVTNLHRAFVGGADRYVPMLAGAAFGEVFVSSVYRRLTGADARSNPKRLREALDFEDAFRATERDDCAPLLARFDRVVEYDRQMPGYDGMDVGVIEKGHLTGALATGVLRGYVERNLAGD